MTRIVAPPSPSTLVSRRSSKSFDAQINAIEADIKTLCAACGPIARVVNALVAIQGVGQKTAAAIIVLMPGLGSLRRRQAAASQALPPIPIKAARPTPIAKPAAEDLKSNQSCSWPAISAAKPNPTLSAFYKRLLSAGENPLVAITAIIRKLVVIANAALRTANALQVS